MDQMTDLDMDRQRHGNFNSEPCMLLRGPNILQSNIRTVATASGSTSNVDSHYLPDTYDNSVMFGVTQYSGIPHQRNLDMGVAVATNIHYSGMNPSSNVVLPLPINHRASDQFPSSSTFSVSGVSSDSFGRYGSIVDDVRGPFKRKSAETIRGNFQYFDASASSSAAPPNARHSDGVAMIDTASLSLPQFQGNCIPSLMEVGPHGSFWSRSGESVMAHEHNHLIRGNYLGQHFQPAAPPWLDQQLNSNNGDGHTTAWNQSLHMPYMQAPNVSGSSIENPNMGLQRYHETTSNLSGLRFLHRPVNHQHHNYHHHPTLPMQGVRGHGISFQPPVTATSYRVPANPSRSTVIPAHNGFEMGPRHIGLAPTAGLQIYRPQRGFTPDTTIGHRNLPPMSFLQVDDVALLDEVGLVDHHRDMRLDIEDMSYEELLALGERIGNVSTGLSEESISTLMNTKIYLTSTGINPEEEASEDQEIYSCIICQDKYKNREKIGILHCGHEYHAECLKKWLHVKNVCPICKSEALTPGKKDNGA